MVAGCHACNTGCAMQQNRVFSHQALSSRSREDGRGIPHAERRHPTNGLCCREAPYRVSSVGGMSRNSVPSILGASCDALRDQRSGREIPLRPRQSEAGPTTAGRRDDRPETVRVEARVAGESAPFHKALSSRLPAAETVEGSLTRSCVTQSTICAAGKGSVESAA
jgi:hypothetical protein